ncbi:MAG: hypothetical protein LC659_06300 [Myxococcales bacterium]|nr:hypothetical protein [Myxococcales bacterium]
MSAPAASSATATTADAPDARGASEELVPAIITGQLAGLIMAVVVIFVFVAFLGKGPLYPVQVIGSLLFGDAALHGIHVGAVIAGLLLHQGGPALFWSLVFGLAVHAWRIEDSARLAALGVAVGVASQLVDVDLVLPPLMRALHGHDIWAAEVPAFWSWAAHVVYGLALGLLFTSVRRRRA